MENEGRRRAFKFFVTACLLSAMYYFVMENILPAIDVDGGTKEIGGIPSRIVATAKKEKKAKRAIEAGFDELNRIEKLLRYDLNRINTEAFVRPVKVSFESFELLKKTEEYRAITNDIFYFIDSDVNSASYKLILDVNAQTVKFAIEGMRLNLEQIDKSFAVDKAIQIMRRKRAIGGMIQISGGISCFGKPAHGNSWLIGIQDSNLPDGNSMVIKLRDMAAATKLSGVTVIAPKAIDADIIACAVTELGTQKGLELVNSLMGIEAIIFTPDGDVIKSNGVDVYLE